MITYNNIVNRFETFVEQHLFLRTFTHGSPAAVDLDKFELYPLLHLVYTGSSYDVQQKTYSLEIYILDLPPDKEKKVENQKALVSNAEQVAEDILADMRTGGHVFDFGHYYSISSASTTTLEEETSNVLSGVLLDISIEVGYEYDSCNAPLEGVSPSGSGVPFALNGNTSVFTVTSDYTQSFVASGAGTGNPATIVDFGSILAGTAGITADMKAGWVAGVDVTTALKTVLCSPLTSGSTIQIEVKYSVVLDTATYVFFSDIKTGVLAESPITYTAVFASESNIIDTGAIGTVLIYQTSNTWQLNLSTNGTGTISMSYVKFTVVHA